MMAYLMRRRALAALLMSGLMPGAWAQEADHPADKPLVLGSDFGVAPWMVRGAAGSEGFGMDLATELARRLHRPSVEVVDVNFSNLFAALFVTGAKPRVGLRFRRADRDSV